MFFGTTAGSAARVAGSAFNDVWGWWRADSVSGTSPAMSFADLSPNGRTMVQQAGTLTPGTDANGQAKITGNATARLDVSGSTLSAWPMTAISIVKRTAAATCGMFGASGANSFNNYWFGWESGNSLQTYNGASAANTDSTGGTTGCYVSRTGYGSRVQFVNGLIQANMGLPSITRPSAIAPSLGTTYRGLNCDWQETLVWNRQLSIAELDEVHAYINERYGLTIPLWSSYTSAPTVWLGGQSNASGRGTRGGSDVNIPAEYRGAIANASVFHGISATDSNTTGVSWEALNSQAVKDGYTGNHMLGENFTLPSVYFGCESVMCKEYLDLNGGSIYLMKDAIGSSNLEYSPGNYHWDPTDNSLSASNAFRMFGVAGVNWWQSMRGHQTAGRKPMLLGAIWYQGEQDATNLTDANNYQANLSAFVSALRAEIGYNAKAFICRLNDECPETYAATVRAAQSAYVASDANAFLVDTDSFEVNSPSDLVHLSHNGQISLGAYLASQL